MLSVPWYAVIIRSVILYGFVFLLFRIAGRRQMGELTNFDLVLVLLMASAVGTGLTGGDSSLGAALLSGGTIFALAWIMGKVTAKSRRVEQIVEGKPQILVHNGVVDHTQLAKAGISFEDLMAAIREAGLSSLRDVHVAILETSGTLSILGYDHCNCAKRSTGGIV